MPHLKAYRRDADYSYTLGAFPTFELLKYRPTQVLEFYMHPSFAENDAASEIHTFAAVHRIPLTVSAREIGRLSPKENCYLIAAFAKYTAALDPQAPHLLLAQPSNRGNLGNIARTMLGFAFHNLALLEPAVDPFDPQVVRASMGAIFALGWASFASLAAYREAYPQHALYPFRLDGATPLEELATPPPLYTLAFGNEASGLPSEFAAAGESVVIRHEAAIDSLNLTIAVALALAHFYKGACR